MNTAAALSPAITERRASHRAVLIVTCLALATVVSAMASLNVALPSLARDTQASQTQLSWVVDAYSLVFAALLLPAGAIGDRFGRKRALVTGLAIFGLGSLAAMATTDATTLILLRGVLGIGAALVMPATLSTITTTFPVEQRGRAVGAWAAVAGGSAVVGLLFSGALLEEWSWRSVFALNVVLAALAIIGTLRFVPESAEGRSARIDIGGAVLAVAGLVALVYTVIEAPDNGWLSTHTLGGLALALLILAGFIGWELRQAHPLLDPRLFGNARFAAGTASILLQFFAFFGYIFVAMQYLQLVRGDSALIAALSVTPMAAALMPSARLAPRLGARVGARTCGVIGLTLIVVGLVVLAQLGQGSSYALLVAGLLPLGAGMGLAMTPATTAITGALPPEQQGVGSAMNDLARELGGALGIAVIGSVLSTTYRSHLDVSNLPGPLADKARSSLAVAAHLGQPVLGHAQLAYLDGMHAALYCAAAVVAGAAVLLAFLLRRPDSGVDSRTVDAQAEARDLS